MSLLLSQLKRGRRKKKREKSQFGGWKNNKEINVAVPPTKKKLLVSVGDLRKQAAELMKQHWKIYDAEGAMGAVLATV